MIYKVYDDNKNVIIEINEFLLKRQNALENLDGIKHTYQKIHRVIEYMEKTDNVECLRKAETLWIGYQFILQKLWNFKENKNHFKFWKLPKCVCPKMDNEDRHPEGFYVTLDSCSLHGKIL